MTTLVIGLLLFIGIHSLPSVPSARSALIGKLRFSGYRVLFSLTALLGLILVIIGMGRAEYVPLWNPPSWGRYAALVLMLPAFILLSGAYLPGNIKRFSRHPMLWGVVLWSLAHLLANGDLASLLLFGSFGVFALFDMASANWRGAALQREKVSGGKDVLVVVVGLVAYGILLAAHPYLFGHAVI